MRNLGLFLLAVLAVFSCWYMYQRDRYLRSLMDCVGTHTEEAAYSLCAKKLQGSL